MYTYINNNCEHKDKYYLRGTKYYSSMHVKVRPLSYVRAVYQFCFTDKSKALPLPHAAVMEEEYSSYSFLASALDRGEWLASHSCRFYPRERTPGSQWIGSCVDLRDGLETETR
jgi:hypothetical protein